MTIGRIAIVASESDVEFVEKVRSGLTMRSYDSESNLDIYTETKKEKVDSLFSDKFICTVIVLSQDLFNQMRHDKYLRDAVVDDLYADNKLRETLLIKNEDNLEIPANIRRFSILPVSGDVDFLVDALHRRFSGLKSAFPGHGNSLDVHKMLEMCYPASDIVSISGRQRVKRKSIGYEIFKIKERLDVFADDKFFIVLEMSATLANTAAHIAENFPDILSEKNVVVLTDSRRSPVDSERHRNNVSRIFGKKVYFVTEFVKNYVIKSILSSEAPSVFPIEFYVDSKISGFNISALEFLDNWWSANDSPVLMLVGAGGIGKTTLIRQFISKSSSDHLHMIYLESAEVLSYLHSHLSEYSNINELYSLYSANQRAINAPQLGREAFEIAIATGTVAIIIDGFDEILTNLANMVNFGEFMDSVHNLNYGNTKVLITCRDNVADFSYPNAVFAELLPFDRRRAEDFFNSRFPHQPKLVKKAISIADEYFAEESDFKYIPFALDIICTISTDDSDEEFKNQFFSDILREDIRFDVIVYSVCNRERVKNRYSLNVDLQVQLFSKMALSYGDSCLDAHFESLVTDVTGNQEVMNLISRVVHNKMIAHPFLVNRGGKISFRNDTLAEQFSVIGSYLSITDQRSRDDDFIRTFSRKAKLGTFYLRTLSYRFSSYSLDQAHYYLYEVVDFLRAYKGNLHQSTIRQALSGIVHLLIQMNFDRGGADADLNTQAVKNVFQDPADDIIKDFVLWDISSSRVQQKVLFNFRGLHFQGAEIARYEWFWNCHFDRKTLFDGSRLIDLQSRSKTTSATANNFSQSCQTDASVQEMVTIGAKKAVLVTQSIHEDMVCFFKLFFDRQIITQRSEHNVHGYYKGGVDVKWIVKCALKTGLLENKGMDNSIPKGVLKVPANAAKEVYDFVYQGVASARIKSIVSELVKEPT